MWLIGPVLGHLALHVTSPANPQWSHFMRIDAIALASLAASLALFIYLRRGDRAPEFVIDLGLAYMVAAAFAIGVLLHWGKPVDKALDVHPMITWTGPLILMFAAIVPAAPWKMLAAGFLAASMDPLGMVLWRAAGVIEFGPVSNVLVMHYPTYLLLGIAVVVSHVVTGLGKQVTKEREMGSYRLEERLGRGGMGEVWRARHQMLARPAAIKLIRPEVLGATNSESRRVLLRRFEREAQATALMRSVHTLELYDFGVADDGTFYYVMELLDGFDLGELVERFGPLPAERAVHLLRQVCDSLAEAHGAGLIHRDVKPANVYVCRYGREVDFIKVLDFGLVKRGSRPEEGADQLTAHNITAGGTPAFMSPEQALGDEAVDGRSDLYAVGCVAYWLLTGTPVFTGRTPMETLLMHVHRGPEPPSRRTHLPIPSDLEAIVMSCLAKDPEVRPQTADELATRLAGVQLGCEWTMLRAREWWDTHRPSPPPSLLPT
jgi:plasmid stabilization system protein ParE